jgi:RNase H-fold protein (predicted Holliday junction resolvase)
MDAGTTALGVAFLAMAGTVATPLLASHFSAKQAAAKQAADYARQDLVAARVTEAAEKVAEVAEQAKETARLLEERDTAAAALAKENAEIVVGKLDSIHVLVNSTLTGAIVDSLAANEQLLQALDDNQRRDAADGRPPGPDQSPALALVREKIAELKATIADRTAQTKVADAQTNGH